ncbi:MAG: hypothetical protein ABL903_19095 [Methylococcales bacterium]
MTQVEHAYSGRRTAKNAWQFLLGKGFSAFCTAFLLGFIVRFLPLSDYGLYVSALAAVETGIALSSLGTDWAIIRYVPYYVIGGSYYELRRFLIIAVLFRLIFLLIYAGIIFGLAYYFKPEQFASYKHALLLLAGLFIIEGLLRLLRENTLESLGNQAFTQIGTLLRQGFFLSLLTLASLKHLPANLDTVLLSEFTAAALALTIIIFFVAITIRPLKKQIPGKDWQAPRFSEIRRTALHNYASDLLSYPYTLQALTLLIASIESPSHAALFGFVTQIVNILRGYLPALLLMNVMRPRLFGLYEMTQDFNKPAAEAKLISRVSFLTIAPIIVGTVSYGDWLIQLASGNRFQEGGMVFLLFTLSLIFRIQRQMATILINCVKHSAILIRNATFSFITFPIFLYLMSTGHVIWFAATAVIWDEILWSTSSKWLLNRADFKWSIDMRFIFKLSLVSIICMISLALLKVPINLTGFIFSTLYIGLFFCAYIYFFNPLGAKGIEIKNMVLSRLKRTSNKGEH